MKKILIAFIVLAATTQAYATRWVIVDSGFTFSPDSLVINIGDTVVFQLAAMHNAQEVGQSTWAANSNFPVTGFQTNFAGGMVTGLGAGTHYYVCQSHVSSGMKGRIIVHVPPVPNVWINELHYDNTGTDTLEGFEIAGNSGANLNCFKVVLYDGTTGQQYLDKVLTGLLPFQTCALGTVWFPLSGLDALHNGPGDALALVFAPQSTGCGLPGIDTVVQFISYEGVVVATNGAANGKTSVNIGVSESGNDAIGNSLQLAGTGTSYNQFIWQNAANSTYDTLNAGQSFCLVRHISVMPAQKYEYEPTGWTSFTVTLDNPGQSPTSVTLAVSNTLTSPYGKAIRGLDYVFDDTTVTWQAHFSGTVTIPIYIIDDTIHEIHEDAFIVATNPTNGAIITADSVFNLGIIGNDPLSGADCSNLFFSEYIDGSGNNKALEIYNPNLNTIDLSDFRIFKSINGGASSAVFGLNGLLLNKGVYVMAYPLADAAIASRADTLSSFFDFDGNDAIALLHGYDTIDIIGQIGVDPGATGWALDSGGTTAAHTLIRMRYIYAGKTDWAIADTQWRAYPVDMFDSLGFHHTGSPCGSGVPPPPATINFITVADSVFEGDTTMKVIVMVDNLSNVPAVFSVARNDSASTATGGQDYTYVIANLSFGIGINYDTVEIYVKDDALTELTETAVLHFINTSSNVIIGPDSTYTLSIMDTDKLTVSFLGAGFSYVEDSIQVQVRVTISTPVDTLVTAIVQIAPGSATPGKDYIYNTDTVFFLPNTIDTQFVLVTLLDDTIYEGNEQINFDLKEVTGGAVTGIVAYTITIIDDDFVGVGINEISFGNAIKLYPNPVSNVLIMESTEDFLEVKIFDLQGNMLIDAGPAVTGEKRINVSELPAGMYFLSVHNTDKKLSGRFVKHKE